METNIEKVSNQEKEIDLIDLGKKLWEKRKFILKGFLIGLLFGVVIAFSIPKEYTSTVILAPEANSSSSAGSVGALAAMAGLNLGGGAVNEGQMSPELYPNIAESTPFIIGLFDIKVRDVENSIDTTLYYYIKDNQKSSWWAKIMRLPFGLIDLVSRSDGSLEEQQPVMGFSLNKEQTSVFNNIKGRIGVVVDKKTGIITLRSTMQNAEISALVADTLTSYLQSYIISYRTQKARQDLSFTERLYLEAKKDYSDLQQKYAKYLDENQNIVLASYRVNQEKLQNEVSLAYGVYNQMAQQLQLAKVKVQDTTPVYTIIQPATVPLIPEKPNKKLIVLSFIFITLVGVCGFIIGKDFLYNKYLNK
ncbi:Wzz/FepE/Etk N-terminal domain-containing protein [Dysgonomonas sp. GY617]|uniref:Wzz/FepE/Etk N-terminal domain-containing protein n=1 Tax=Dysgonomonas sp. GY617 TaxID=2780420 RepID=UPI0018846634|nr:Wzz/FepE/Etk N-terminal domain-containing protein [Dysgonomonas sp. GY617]MBF0576532.1 chain-length determining protein [Dysgonomonas sp. GY617]